MRQVASYNEETHVYKTPSLALKLGHTLKKCAQYMKFEALKEGDDAKKKAAKTLIVLYECNWEESVSAKALFTLEQKRYNKPQLLPIVQDVVKLDQFLKGEAKRLC